MDPITQHRVAMNHYEAERDILDTMEERNAKARRRNWFTVAVIAAVTLGLCFAFPGLSMILTAGAILFSGLQLSIPEHDGYVMLQQREKVDEAMRAMKTAEAYLG